MMMLEDIILFVKDIITVTQLRHPDSEGLKVWNNAHNPLKTSPAKLGEVWERKIHYIQAWKRRIAWLNKSTTGVDVRQMSNNNWFMESVVNGIRIGVHIGNKDTLEILDRMDDFRLELQFKFLTTHYYCSLITVRYSYKFRYRTFQV